MATGTIDLLKTNRTLVRGRPVLPMLTGPEAPGPGTEAELTQLYLQTGEAPKLWLCVQDTPERVWKRIAWGKERPHDSKDVNQNSR